MNREEIIEINQINMIVYRKHIKYKHNMQRNQN